MIVVDKEPAVNIEPMVTSQTAAGLLSPEIQATKEAVNLSSQQESVIGRGAARIRNKLSSMISSLGHMVDNLYRRRGRGPCPGCEGGTGVHHWGSKCKMRRQPGPRINLFPEMSFNRSLILNPSVFR